MPDFRPLTVSPAGEFAPTSAYWTAGGSAPVRETTIGSVLRDAAARAPGAIALVDGDPDPARRRQWTFAELLADAERAARALLTRFTPGERVAVWSQNRPEWVLLEFAAALAGLVLVTVDPALQGEELARLLGHSRADGLVHAGGEQAGLLAEVRERLPRLRDVLSFDNWRAFTASGGAGLAAARPLPEVKPASAAQVRYTSGTTGRPTGAVLSHRVLTNNARIAFETAGIVPGDVALNPLPLFGAGGSTLFTLGPLQAGAAQVLMPRFSPALALELTEACRVTVLGGVPAMLLALLDQADLLTRDVSALRLVLAGGAVSPPALVHRAEAELGITYTVGYVQAEAGCMLTMTTAADAPADRAHTLGRPLPGTELRIARLTASETALNSEKPVHDDKPAHDDKPTHDDEPTDGETALNSEKPVHGDKPAHGETAVYGETGEICARGYFAMDRYLSAPQDTAAVTDAGGWLHTGDLGSLDERGYLRIASGRTETTASR